MKKFFVLLCGIFLVLGSVGGASAVPFPLEFSYDVLLLEEDPGLVLEWGEIFDNPGTLDLEVCQPQTVKLFSLWTEETAINPDDINHDPIEVDFEFASGGSGQVEGETYGWKVLFGLIQGGAVEWEDPQTLYFGKGGELVVELHDAIFNVGLFGTFPGECFGADIYGTFHLTKEPAPVPEPATMLLLGTGLVGLAAFRRKFKK